MKILLTGASGFLAAWIAGRLHRRGFRLRGMDLRDERTVLDQVAPEVSGRLDWQTGDVSDLTAVRAAAEGCDLIIHLAAILTPACQADPIRGAHINLLGTLNVFEAARELGHDKVLYMSSAGVFGPDDGAVPWPTTHYGAFKLAGEGSARAFWADHGLASLGLRPLVVYGPGRETGLTAGPTLACRAAARGEAYTIPFSGRSGFVFADDVAAVFEAATLEPLRGAEVYNLGGEVASVPSVVDVIKDAVPGARIDYSGPAVPTAADIADNGLYQRFAALPRTGLADGLARTLAFYSA